MTSDRHPVNRAATFPGLELSNAATTPGRWSSREPDPRPRFRAQACGCCGIVGCYCGCPAAAWGQSYGASQLANVPPIGTQAAVTPDWTDVITSLTRETSEDTAEIASLTGPCPPTSESTRYLTNRETTGIENLTYHPLLPARPCQLRLPAGKRQIHLKLPRARATSVCHPDHARDDHLLLLYYSQA